MNNVSALSFGGTYTDKLEILKDNETSINLSDFEEYFNYDKVTLNGETCLKIQSEGIKKIDTELFVLPTYVKNILTKETYQVYLPDDINNLFKTDSRDFVIDIGTIKDNSNVINIGKPYDITTCDGFIPEISMSTKYYYHVTYNEMCDTILKEGLRPQVGANHQRIQGYDEDRVYLTDLAHLSKWYTILNADTILRVDASILDKSKLKYTENSELFICESIPPEAITKVNIGIDASWSMTEVAFIVLLDLSEISVAIADGLFEDEPNYKDLAICTYETAKCIDFSKVDSQGLKVKVIPFLEKLHETTTINTDNITEYLPWYIPLIEDKDVTALDLFFEYDCLKDLVSLTRNFKIIL